MGLSWYLNTQYHKQKPVDLNTTLKFCEKVRPNGAWAVVGHKVNYSDLVKKFSTWIALTIMVYSVLLIIGKIIFS